MIIAAIFGVLTLVTLVAAYLGAKHWHWAHVTIVVALFFTMFGFSFLVAKTLDTRLKWQKIVHDNEPRLEEMTELVNAVERGTDQPDVINKLIARDLNIDEQAAQSGDYRMPGIVDLEHRLRLASRKLGRVWRNAQPISPVDRQTLQVTVGIEFPQPLGINENAILFVFEQGPANAANPDQGRKYLGEFRVTAADVQQLTLEPVLRLDPVETQRLGASRGPWALYETMPADRRDTFAGYSEQQLRQLLPAESIEEYLREGTPWTVDDGEWTKGGRDEKGNPLGPDQWTDETRFVYQRRLRDYDFLFNDLAKQRTAMQARQQALSEDLAKLQATLSRAKEITAAKQAEQSMLVADKKGVISDREAIEAHAAALNKQVAAAERLLERTLAANADLAERIEARQRELAGGTDLDRSPLPSRGGVDVDAL